mmetsp:Transcript_11469/g.17624  ORF Transcript_11469/g.17624 Transcript_11469/m.17624 type:complete len:97 (-) Transcript_11469:57-347(-)
MLATIVRVSLSIVGMVGRMALASSMVTGSWEEKSRMANIRSFLLLLSKLVQRAAAAGRRNFDDNENALLLAILSDIMKGYFLLFVDKENNFVCFKG